MTRPLSATAQEIEERKTKKNNNNTSISGHDTRFIKSPQGGCVHVDGDVYVYV